MSTASPRLAAQDRLLAAALACWIGFTIVAQWQASGASAGFDRAGLLMWRRGPTLMPIGPAWLTHLMRSVTLLGNSRERLAIACLAFLILLFRRHIRAAVILAATAIPAIAIDSCLKLLFARPRPMIVPHLASYSQLSFPSGHSFNGSATYIGIALAAAAIAPRERIPMITVGLILSLAIAFSRVWLGVHYPTDVIAGLLGGAGWALLVWAALGPPNSY
jgi:undecaprenyl-diphosphatase